MVVGENAGSKETKARELGLTILDEDQFALYDLIWKRTVAQIAQLQDGQIRFFALLALGAGVLMLCF